MSDATYPYEAAPGHWVLFANDGEHHVFGAMSAEHAESLYLEALTPPITEGDYARAIQHHVDTVARGRDFDDGNSAAGYVNSTIAAWAADAAAFVAWRDAVWVYAFQQFALVTSGQRARPEIAELIAELPSIVWPT
jgi:uncharacterized membrane protein YgcG